MTTVVWDDVQLDVGDLGLNFIEGVGFRPVDGVDQYGSGKSPCPVVAVYKNTKLDTVERETVCAAPAPVYARFQAPTPELIVYPTYVTTSTPWTVPPAGVPPITWVGCCTTITSTPPIDIPPPAVPIPASGVLMASLVMAVFVRKALQA